jgi:hypothetical protein
MANKPIVKQSSGQLKSNPIESLKDFGNSTVRNAGSSIRDLGTGMIDQLLGGYFSSKDQESSVNPEAATPKTESITPSKGKKEANIFNYQEYHESVMVKQEIRQLVEAIRKEIKYLQKADKSLLNDVKDIEKIAIDSLPEKPGIYHVRFLEIVLRTLRLLREKIGESKTWMQALISKKKKRGSLFAVRSKKSGTQYSQSQELSTARSVQ